MKHSDHGSEHVKCITPHHSAAMSLPEDARHDQVALDQVVGSINTDRWKHRSKDDVVLQFDAMATRCLNGKMIAAIHGHIAYCGHGPRGGAQSLEHNSSTQVVLAEISQLYGINLSYWLVTCLGASLAVVLGWT